jgi:sugar (pentulose or hexulose) kinase
MDLLLGLGVGTTATKALLMDVKGKVMASASYGYGLITPHENWEKQNPDDLWNGVVVIPSKLVPRKNGERESSIYNEKHYQERRKDGYFKLYALSSSRSLCRK